MIKDNHFNSNLNLKIILKKALKTKKIITVEIENIKQLREVLDLKFKRILFDNMNLNTLQKCLKICGKKYETEYSGNVSLKNIKKISKTNVNRISIGALTHSFKAFDLSLVIKQ
jgi:nicotinate-nucleotide pyrophosphorylase (carboxylating)